MAQLFHLSSSNVSDTFHKLVQTEGGRFSDGSGSVIHFITANQTSSMTVATASYAISASHEITYELSSSFANTASYVAGENVDGTVSSATVADLADCADQVKTSRTDTNSSFYIPFVTDNNTSPTCEQLYTSQKFFINPSSGLLTLLGKFKVKGSDVTIDGGHISMSGHLHMSGTLSSSQVLTTNLGSDQQYISSASIGHISTYGDTIKFVDPVTKKVSGSLKFDESGITVQSADAAVKTGAKLKWLNADSYITTNGDITASGHIAAEGNISSSLSVIGASVQTPIIIGDASYATSLDVGGSIWASGSLAHITSSGTITADGNISSSATIIGNNISSSVSIYSKSYYVNNTQAAGEDVGKTLLWGPDSDWNAFKYGRPGAVEPHTFYGNITSSNNIQADGKISASGNIVSSKFVINEETINGVGFTNPSTGILNIKAGSGDALQQINFKTDKASFQSTAHTIISASGLISSSAEVYGTDFYSYNKNFVNYHKGDDIFRVSADGTPVEFFSSIKATNITASGDISSSGNIYADRYHVNEKLAIDYIPSLTQIVYGQNNQGSKLRGATIILGEGTDQHVTASGNLIATNIISSSQGHFDRVIVTDGNYDANGTGKYRVDGYSAIQNSSTTLKIAGNNYWEKITYGNEDTDQHSFTGHVSSSGNISASVVEASDGHVIAYNTSSLTGANMHRGEVVKFGNTSTTEGQLYAFTGSGWTIADSGSGVATASLGLALGTNSTTDGMLLRGFMHINSIGDSSPGGAPLYMNGGASVGRFSPIAPGASGTYARIVGYNYGTNILYFCPDNTWVKLS